MSSTPGSQRLKRLVRGVIDRRPFILSFFLGFIIRAIPEALSYPYPIGFDTVYYAARINGGVIWYRQESVFSTWLLYAILTPLNSVIQNPFLVLKLAVPVIFALNACGIYYFATRALHWSPRKALMASLLFTFSMASLGLSWHFHKNMLGLALLLFALPSLSKIDTNRGFAWFSLLSILIVFSHEFVSVILFAGVLGLLVIRFLKGERKSLLRPLTAIIPASLIFLVVIYVKLFFPPFDTPPNVISTEDIVYPHPLGMFFMVDYLRVEFPLMYYATYTDLVFHVTSLFSLLYLAWIPLVIVGFFRNELLDGWAFLLFFSSFNVLITPYLAVDLWYRWMLMLVCPLVYYATNGIEKAWKSKNGFGVSEKQWLEGMKISKRSVSAILLLTISLGSIYITTPLIYDRFGIFSIPTTYSYIPSTMLYNTIPLRDVNGVVKSFEWLNEQMNDSSVVVLQQALVTWAELYLNTRHKIVYFQIDANKALDLALSQHFTPIYFVWWNQDVGWYGVEVPQCFKYVFTSDRISVYQYMVQE